MCDEHEEIDNNICFDCQMLGLSFSSVGRAMDSSSRGAGFDPRHEYRDIITKDTN